MKKWILITCFIPFLGLAQLSDAEELAVDSLQDALSTAKHDTIKINIWVAWDNIIYATNPDLDQQLNERIRNKCVNNLQQSVSAEEELFYKSNLSFAFNNLGIINDIHGNVGEAIENYTNSLRLKEELGDKAGMSKPLNNIGLIYFDQGNHEKAIEYYNQSLEIAIEMEDIYGMSKAYSSLAVTFGEMDEIDTAIALNLKSVELQLAIEDEYGLAQSYNNLGTIYNHLEQFDKAQEYHLKSLVIRRQNDNNQAIATSLLNLGITSQMQGYYHQSILYLEEAFDASTESRSVRQMKESADYLYHSYKNVGRFKEALEMHEQFIALRDTLQSNLNKDAILRQEYDYAYEKQHLSDSLAFEQQNAMDALSHKKELEKEYQQKVALYIILGLAVIFAGFIFNRFRVIRKQKGIIEEQKEQVHIAFEHLEEKNNEILDSINYAKRIQSAILPPDKIVNAYLPDSFVLYKPKDVVAGDFYWMEKVGDQVLFAAADCTGHGVPGAMVSVVCNGALNRSVREFGLTDTGKILDKSREIVIQEFEKSEEEVKDGMDIALCGINGTELTYSGANNPLWIVRNNEVLETKADKQPIGKFEAAQAFTSHSIELQKGDIVYVFSDGYVDQFGGEKGKKFKAKALRELLLSINSLPMKEQKDRLEKAFEDWRGSLEQIDDVCFIGVRV